MKEKLRIQLNSIEYLNKHLNLSLVKLSIWLMVYSVNVLKISLSIKVNIHFALFIKENEKTRREKKSWKARFHLVYFHITLSEQLILFKWIILVPKRRRKNLITLIILMLINIFVSPLMRDLHLDVTWWNISIQYLSFNLININNIFVANLHQSMNKLWTKKKLFQGTIESSKAAALQEKQKCLKISAKNHEIHKFEAMKDSSHWSIWRSEYSEKREMRCKGYSTHPVI